jgi:hypothetical protein
VLTFSVMCAIILDLLSGFAIELRFPPQFKLLGEPAVQDALGTIAAVRAERKSNLQKSPIKRAFRKRAILERRIYCAASC